MKSAFSGIVLAACLAVLLARTVTAQEDEPVDAGNIRITVEDTTLTASTLTLTVPSQTEEQKHIELAEDMQIMGRLLEEALETAYRQPTKQIPSNTLVFQDDGLKRVFGVGVASEYSKGASSADHVREPLSVYLEGQGIVFQTEAPLPRQVGKDDGSVSKQDGCPFLARSPWERMAVRLQGDGQFRETCKNCHDSKASNRAFLIVSLLNADSNTAPTGGQLVDALTEVLAESGHNVRHLPSEERLTFALTFKHQEYGNALSSREGREDKWVEQAIGNAANAATKLHINGFYLDDVQRKATEDLIRKGVPVLNRGRRWNSESPPLAGDLLLKTHQYDGAIDAYQKALKEAGVQDIFQHSPDATQRNLYQKLIQAYVGAAKLDEAQKLILLLQTKHKNQANSEKPLPSPLPSRLVVSATKAQLDQVASGEMSREEFAGQVKVQFYEGRGAESSEQASSDGKDLEAPQMRGVLYDGIGKRDADASGGWKDRVDPRTGGILIDKRNSTPLPPLLRKR